jgi:tyrosyl-DNA phosphodiesterase 2
MSSIADEPVIPSHHYPLKVYHYRRAKGGAWKHVSGSKINDQTYHPSSIKIVTWNVDFQSPQVRARVHVALQYLEKHVFKCPRGEAPEPCVIMLQEVHSDALPHLLDYGWIRDHFVVTPINHTRWPNESHYGNVTLVSRTLVVVKACILHFGHSSQSRAGVVVDIKLNTPATAAESREVTMRLINTHLESLPDGVHYRPIQLSILASYLKKRDEVQGGVIAGDMNAIGPSEVGFPVDVGLRDAWRKPDGDESGFTWGYQGGGDFPAARLDKVLYLPRRGYKVDEPGRIGIDLRAEYTEGGEDIWVSDHYGLVATLRVLRQT